MGKILYHAFKLRATLQPAPTSPKLPASIIFVEDATPILLFQADSLFQVVFVATKARGVTLFYVFLSKEELLFAI